VQINRAQWRTEESFDSRPRQGIFLVFTISRLVLETIQPACPEEKRPWHKLFSPLHIPTYVELHLTYLFNYLLNYLLAPRNRVLLQKLSVSQLVKKLFDFMEPEGSLPPLQLPATCRYPKPDHRVHTTTSHILKIYPNIILSSTPGFPKWLLSLRYPHQNTVHAFPLPHTRFMTRPSHSSRLYHPNNIGWGVQITNLLIM